MTDRAGRVERGKGNTLALVTAGEASLERTPGVDALALRWWTRTRVKVPVGLHVVLWGSPQATASCRFADIAVGGRPRACV